MWRLVALDIVFHLHSIRDFSIRLDKDWSVLQPTRASWFLLYASLRRFISLTLQRRHCKLWTQNQPVRLWQRWGYGAKETMSISGCIRTWKKGNCLSAVCLCRCDLLDEYVETERPSLSISRAERSRLRLRKSPATRPSRPPLRSITAHFMAPTSGSIQPASVWVCVCVIYVMCGSWGRFRLTENLRRVNKQSRTGCTDKCVIMLLDLSAVRSEHLKY